MSSEKVLLFQLIMLMNALINSCRSKKRGSLAPESDPLTEEETGGKRERGRRYVKTKLTNPAEVKAMSHINTCKEEGTLLSATGISTHSKKEPGK